jgi:NADPH2:quinone reductase
MKALVSRLPGPPESLVLEDVSEPEPGPREVRIRVAACGVNFPDLLIVQDKYQIKPPRPFIPGAEAAGIVDRVGADVSTVAPGDRVMAVCSWGGMAEKLVVPAARCSRVPDGMPLDEAAALQITYGTAHYGLKYCGRLVPGERLLVLGAAGGVGVAAVEIGKALGAQVIAAVSSEAKAAIARNAGADSVLIYPPGPFDAATRGALASTFKAALDGGVNVVLDPVGGEYTEAAFRSIAPGGRLVVVGFAAGISSIRMNLVLLKGAQIVGAAWGAVVEKDPAAYGETIGALVDLYARRMIRPLISARLPLERGAEALRLLQARAAVGKIVVVPG